MREPDRVAVVATALSVAATEPHQRVASRGVVNDRRRVGVGPRPGYHRTRLAQVGAKLISERGLAGRIRDLGSGHVDPQLHGRRLRWGACVDCPDCH